MFKSINILLYKHPNGPLMSNLVSFFLTQITLEIMPILISLSLEYDSTSKRQMRIILVSFIRGDFTLLFLFVR